MNRLFLLGAALCLAGCAAEAPPSRVLLIGLDGAEWSLIRPLMESGEMPNMAKLVSEGSSGPLRSLVPAQKSPAIWTTIATGRSPEEHGIRSFVNEKDGRPLTQNMRKVKALWSIFSATGKKVGVTGWLMSWPAEHVNGYIITDYIQYEAAQDQRLVGQTWPPEYFEKIHPWNRDWRQMPWSEVQEFLAQPLAEDALAPNLMQKIAPIRWMISADATFTDIAVALGKEEPTDFTAVYLRSMDTMGHNYWNYQDPAKHPVAATVPALVPYLSEAMPRNYKWIDGQIGRLLELADENTTIILCSDHGFKGGGKGGVQDHKPDGILVVAGARTVQGEIEGATVYDITPTVLALMGYPPSDEMRGKILWDAFDESLRPEMMGETIPTYEFGPPTGFGEDAESPVDEELMERLRSLGYIK